MELPGGFNPFAGREAEQEPFPVSKIVLKRSVFEKITFKDENTKNETTSYPYDDNLLKLRAIFFADTKFEKREKPDNLFIAWLNNLRLFS